jgi:hypothetical protein
MNAAKRPNKAAPSLSTPALLPVPMKDTPQDADSPGDVSASPWRPFMCHSLNAAAVAGKPVEFFEPRQAQSDGVAAMELALEVVRPGVAPNEEK